MPSMAHKILVDMFRDSPSLAAEILAEPLGVSLPPYSEARLASTDLTESAEHRPDAVIVLLDRNIPVRVITVEVQLAVDPRKRFSWPAYVTVSRAIHGCPASLLIVAPGPVVAGWCAEPIATGVPGFVLHPSVFAIPVVKEAWVAARWLELGVLSALVYGESEQGATIAAAVLPAIRDLDDERARFYFDLVYSSLNDAARRAVEHCTSDFAEKYIAHGRRIAETVRALLTVFRVRGIAVPDAIRERILGQKDLARLERWLEKAAVATSVAEVIDEPN